MQVTALQLPDLLEKVLKQKIVPFVTSAPGIGKSSIAHQLAKKFNLKVIDVRLAQCDPTDINGFPFKNEQGNKAGYVPMDTFPIEGDPIPAGYSGWLLLLDEFNSAPLSVQAAAYKLILDRMVGQYALHSNVAMMAAGNRVEDKAIVNRMSTALQSRFAHFQLMLDKSAWLKWAAENHIDPRVTAFINSRPDALHNFNPDHSDYTYACPRTWEFCSRVVQDLEQLTIGDIPLMASVIDEGSAREFYAYSKIFDDIPSLENMIKNADTMPIPDEPSVLYAMQSKISHHMTEHNADTLMKLLKRMPVEFLSIGLRQAIRRDKKIYRSKEIKLWVKDHTEELMT